MNASEGIQFIKAVKELGIKEEAAEKIVLLVESQKGELATKADIEQLKEGQKEQREQSRKEIEQAERRLEASIKGNRWAITIAISAIGLVFTAIITGSIFFWGQISDMRADIRELLQGQQASQTETDQATNQVRQ